MKKLLLALCCVAFPAFGAVGDMVVQGAHALANNTQTSVIQPGAGVEWLITTCAGSGAFEIDYSYDNVNYVAIDTYAAGSVHGLQWRLTSSQGIKIKNVSGGSADVVCQGVQTK